VALDPSKHAGLPAADEKFLKSIDTFGWHVMNVLPRAGEIGPSFSYSSGLFHSYGHPEIILFGLDHKVMHRIINDVGGEVKNGRNFEANIPYGNVLADYSCVFKNVLSAYYQEYVGYSLWFYESHKFPMLQFFWPDKSNRFPWDPECNDGIRQAQPRLDLPAR
jgi:hypothetical protein